MRIEFLKRCVSSEGRYHEVGSIADVPDDIARDLIRRQMALEAVETQEEPQ